MTEELPWGYRVIYDALQRKAHPRQEVSIKEFKETLGQTVNAKGKDWFHYAKDLDKYGIIKKPPNGGRSIQLIYPETKGKMV